MRLNRSCLLLLVLLACAGIACTRTTPAVEVDALPPNRAKRAAPPVLNVPDLVGRNIDEVRKALGKPRETQALPLAAEPTAVQLRTSQAEEWTNTFDYQGATIVATFNAHTRKVRDLVLLGTNEDELMRRGNLDLVGDTYLVLPVPSPAEPSKIMGIRVLARK
ncbi:hypothetical protein [Solirubrum puertoriconensis]|uniref:Uncharacterized protein n=1 Tax=Solirubrum puertoriconensis TaxID=1751427 RepID=A0A9X0HLZ1_SOLP1|nr:hypothetical protein [Solirubrum puertoriconensis]KUG08395.1 hypothetical protein ASU33_09510 [Solirubrum puertoriconensis]